MMTPTAFLMDTKFYSPSVNAALYDGPLKIYFAPAFEEHALKIYFKIQDHFKKSGVLNSPLNEEYRRHLIILLYPSRETYNLSFGSQSSDIVRDELNGDPLLATYLPIHDERMMNIVETSFDFLMDAMVSKAPQEAVLSDL